MFISPNIAAQNKVVTPDTDEALDVLSMCLMCLQVPDDNTGLWPVRPVKGIHQAASKVAPLVLRLHIGEVDEVLHSKGQAQATPLPG